VSAAGVVVRPAGRAGRREAGCRKRCGQPLSSFPWFPGPRLPVRTSGPALAEPLFPAELPARRRQRYTISSRASMKREQVLSEEVAVRLSSAWFGEGRGTHSLAAVAGVDAAHLLANEPARREHGPEPDRDHGRWLRPPTRRGRGAIRRAAPRRPVAIGEFVVRGARVAASALNLHERFDRTAGARFAGLEIRPSSRPPRGHTKGAQRGRRVGSGRGSCGREGRIETD
jgi:hypothetical protein